MQYDATGNIHGDIGSGSAWLTTAANVTWSGTQYGWNSSGWNMVTETAKSAGYAIYLNGQHAASGTLGGTPLFDSNNVL